MPDLSLPDLASQIDPDKKPRHIAVVMDGNGRWAKSRFKPRVFGHKAGAESVRRTVEACARLGIEVLTLYAFSEENWGRPKDEVSSIFSLLDQYILSEKEKLKANNIRFKVIGRIDGLPQKTKNSINETIAYLSHSTGMTLVVAISYGSRQEIAEAVSLLLQKALDEGLQPKQITPNLLEEHLFTSGLPDVDLLIRTSGEKRISNFLLWQIAYAELWFTDKCWPDFKEEDLYLAILDFQKRSRRFGLIS